MKVKNIGLISLITTFALLLLGLIVYKQLTNFIMLSSLIILGLFSHYLKRKNEKLLALAFLTFLSLFSIYYNGIKWGIDFKGGTRIPITLEKPVSLEVMQEITKKIKGRLSTLGLEQIVVKAIGNNLIYLEVPYQNQSTIKRFEEIIMHQGIFIGVVDGQIVLKGDDILQGTVVGVLDPAQLNGKDWGVQFSISGDAAERFAKMVRGKAGYPVYMFLDRPKNAVIVLNKTYLLKLLKNKSIDFVDFIEASYDVLNIKSLEKIDLAFYENLDNKNYTNKTIIIEKGLNINKQLKEKNKIIRVERDDLYPDIVRTNNKILIDSWRAIGLISAPTLSEDATQGNILVNYEISGEAGGIGQARLTDALNKQKTIISVLKGGAFPVKLEIGSETTIPPTLGKKFLWYSAIALLISAIAVAIFVALRYRRLRIIGPMVLISIIELIILIAIVGSFTIDPAAMAGIIASTGVSIDAQIVITDELLKADKKDSKKALKKAFDIINNNAIVGFLAVVPLLFIGVVEVIGFAISTMFSYTLGVLISRPSYAAIVEDLIK